MTFLKPGLALLSLGLLACGADSDNDSGITNQDSALEQGAGACLDGCLERELGEERCAALCAEGTDARCGADCMAKTGDEIACRRRCRPRATCYAQCFARQPDTPLCRERCYPGVACYAQCLSEGGDDELCRPRCAGLTEEAPCNDGDEAERDGVIFVCTDGQWAPKV